MITLSKADLSSRSFYNRRHVISGERASEDRQTGSYSCRYKAALTLRDGNTEGSRSVNSAIGARGGKKMKSICDMWQFKINTSLVVITAGVCLILAASMNVAIAQGGSSSSTTTVSLPKFEVASVRPSPPAEEALNAMLADPGGRMLMRGCTVEYLVMEAFHLQPFQVAGGPSWINQARYNIEAKPPLSSEAAKANPSHAKDPPNDEQRKMLQSLLIERFQLTFHRTSVKGRVYLLTANQTKSRLKPPKDKNEYSWAGRIGGSPPDGEELRGINISMSQLSERLSGWLKFPIIDKTNLKGAFDFEYRFDEGDLEPTMDMDESIIRALNEIGLDLKKSTGPVEMLVIDHVERPSEN
jgi:uncharacterized protein (TIGR03435 family)